MIKITVNGREYNLKDTFAVSTYRRIQERAAAIKDEDAQRHARVDATLSEMLLDKDGNPFESADAVLDAVDIRDVEQIIETLYGNNDPLAVTTDSDTV
jgi:hypothetical protein